MKLRVGNGCWHAGHVQVAAYCSEAGLFAQAGIDAAIVRNQWVPQLLEQGLKSQK